MGIELSQKMLSDIMAFAQENPDVKVATIGGKKINIAEALSHYKPQNQPASVQDNKQNVISRQPYSYNNQQGVLIKYDNGTVVFTTTDRRTKTIREFHFEKEKDLKANRPDSQTIYPQGNKNNKITNYFKYHRNGKYSSIKTVSNKGTVESEFNKDGKVDSRKTFDNKGNLKFEDKFKYDKKENKTQIQRIGGDKKLITTTDIQYAQDGKTKISAQVHDAKNQLIQDNKYDDKGKIKTSQIYYPDGKIKADTEYWDNGVVKEQLQYDQNGKVTKKISSKIDGTFENSAQKSEGDCYLMSTINAIRNLDNGQKMLSDLVKISTNDKGEKVYTVSFPGAKLAAEGLKTDKRVNPDKMYITGTYNFTESEMQKILKQAGKKYSIGDGDVILLEAAFEKYRKEADRTMKENGISKNSYGEAGLQTGQNSNNILAGGYGTDATFILTGQKSQVYKVPNPQYGLSYSAAQSGELVVGKINRNQTLSKAAISEVDGKITNNRKELNKMLDQIMNDPKDGSVDISATAGFIMLDKNGKVTGGHELTIKSVTNDTVTLINPWFPDKEITMSRADFLQSAKDVTLTNTKKGSAPSTPTTSTPTTQNPVAGNNPTPEPTPTPTPTPNPTQDHPVQNNPTPNKPDKIEQGKYTVPEGLGYNGMIIAALRAQGIEPTAENIKKAKAQFKEANPDAVKTYNGRRSEWRGNEYLLKDAEIVIPKFNI